MIKRFAAKPAKAEPKPDSKTGTAITADRSAGSANSSKTDTKLFGKNFLKINFGFFIICASIVLVSGCLYGWLTSKELTTARKHHEQVTAIIYNTAASIPSLQQVFIRNLEERDALAGIARTHLNLVAHAQAGLMNNTAQYIADYKIAERENAYSLSEYLRDSQNLLENSLVSNVPEMELLDLIAVFQNKLQPLNEKLLFDINQRIDFLLGKQFMITLVTTFITLLLFWLEVKFYSRERKKIAVDALEIVRSYNFSQISFNEKRAFEDHLRQELEGQYNGEMRKSVCDISETTDSLRKSELNDDQKSQLQIISDSCEKLFAVMHRLSSNNHDREDYEEEFDSEEVPPHREMTFDVDHENINLVGTRVLMIESDQDAQKGFAQILDNKKLDYCMVEDIHEGLTVMQKAFNIGLNIECLIINTDNDKMSFSNLLTIMQEDEDLRKLPVLVLCTDDEMAEKAASMAQDVKVKAKTCTHAGIIGGLNNLLSDNTVQVTPIVSKADRKAEILANEQQIEEEHATTNVDQLPIVAEPVDILICEDDDANRLVISQILKNAGISFHLAKDGQEGMECFKRLNPKLVVTDISMPNSNGFSFTHELRKTEKISGTYTPVIALTSHSGDVNRERCLDAGMDDYLQRPIAPDKLLAKVTHWLEPVPERKRA
ncbi:MAG: response regulator [Pseudomonadota bacterium]